MENFDHLHGASMVLLTSLDSAGRAVHRPVRISFDSHGNAQVSVGTESALARRLDDCAEVRLAPADFRFRPTGSDQPALAQRLGDDVPSRGSGLGRLRHHTNYRLVPTDEPTSWAASEAR